jgi:hypothetical protein
VHETFNSISDINFADGYRRVYGTSANGVPTAAVQDVPMNEPNSDGFIDEDLIVAAFRTGLIWRSSTAGSCILFCAAR